MDLKRELTHQIPMYSKCDLDIRYLQSADIEFLLIIMVTLTLDLHCTDLKRELGQGTLIGSDMCMKFHQDRE